MNKAVALAAIGLLIAVSARGQDKPLMAEDVFKNIQVLKGIPVKEFMNTMGFFSAATNLNCIDCHSPQSESLEGYAIDTPKKQTARRMVLMVNQINQANFGGRKMVTCYTCHRASDRPEAVPSLLDQYSVPRTIRTASKSFRPDRCSRSKRFSGSDSRQVHPGHRRGRAGGAAHQLCREGTYEGYDTLSAKVPVDIFANSPNQLTTVVHTQNGDSVTTYDGRNGWIAAADKLMRVLPLDGAIWRARRWMRRSRSPRASNRTSVAHRIPVGHDRRSAG
jgi:hypothetical protein